MMMRLNQNTHTHTNTEKQQQQQQQTSKSYNLHARVSLDTRQLRPGDAAAEFLQDKLGSLHVPHVAHSGPSV